MASGFTWTRQGKSVLENNVECRVNNCTIKLILVKNREKELLTEDPKSCH